MKRINLSRPLRFIRQPQPSSLQTGKPQFTPTKDVRDKIFGHLRKIGAVSESSGWLEMNVTDLDVTMRGVHTITAHWSGDEIRLTKVADMDFFRNGHQYLIEIGSVAARKPYTD